MVECFPVGEARMYRTVANVFMILIWLSQFYSVVALVVWLNRNAAAPRPGLAKIKKAMTVQVVILAAIVLFFAFDYIRLHAAGSPGGTVSLRVYLLNGGPFLIIPAIFLLILRKAEKRCRNSPSG